MESTWRRAWLWMNRSCPSLSISHHPTHSCLPSTASPGCLLPTALHSLTQLERDEGLHPLAPSHPPSRTPEGGIHGLRSEPRISCVIPSCVWAISFPTQEMGPGLEARTTGPSAWHCSTHL